MQKLYYQFPETWFGDCMPFGHGDKFYLYHQRDTRKPGPFGEPFGWDLATTSDFVHYEDCGVAIPRGTDEEQDQFIFAGSVFEAEGQYHIFYTGYNRDYPALGKPSQVLMHAYSDDLVTWHKTQDALTFTPQEGYDSDDWRDPWVIRDEENDQYLLVLGTRLQGPKTRQAGRTVKFTSKDLKNWTKHGLAFEKAYDGRFARIATKSASILTKVKGGKLVIDKVDGKYFMYWGEYAVHAATSDNLTDWYPVLDENNELLKIAKPRNGYFDSQMTECGPPAIRTKQGIVLMYNGKNDKKRGDINYPAGAYCAGQLLLDSKDPYKVLGRLDKPFFMPEAPFEKSGQYKDGTVFIEGLAYYKKKLYLYYGCADSKVAVAVCDDIKGLLKVK